MLDGIVAHRVQVVGKRREFGSDGVGLLDKGRCVGLKMQAAHSKLGRSDATRDLAISKATLLRLVECSSANVRGIALCEPKISIDR